MHRHLGVLGSPISHSRSPRIHQAAYAQLGLSWHYEAIECEVAGLKQLLSSRSEEWLGFSVTMPLKEEARRLCSVLDPVASESGVVNTLLRLIDHGGEAAWAGFNTDVGGLAAALAEAELDARQTIVLGAGATAVSAVLAARERGAESITVLARRVEAAEEIARQFADGALPFQIETQALGDPQSANLDAASLVISTLPGHAAAGLELHRLLMQVPLFDVAYDPWPSPLSQRWREASGVAVSGIGMLVHQALLQVRIFVNGDPSCALENESVVLRAMKLAAGAGS